MTLTRIPRSERTLDLVLWGATGFTGQLVAEELERRYGGSGLRWALGGRDPRKLEALRAALGAPSRELFVGDALDPESMAALARRARVVCTTVGPYGRYGSPLVAACAAEGTDCCDLSGEVPWMRRMRAEHAPAAEATGARIVHACGFDSIPSDLGVAYIQAEATRRFGVPSPVVKGVLTHASGGVSGGTIASMLDLFEGSGGLRGALGREDAGTDGAPEPTARTHARAVPHYDRHLGVWTAPFVMAPVNASIVRRSAMRMPGRYGAGLRYEESVATGRGVPGAVAAYGMALGLAAAAAALSIGPLRRAIAPRLPQPGDGPGSARRESGSWAFRFLALPPALAGGAPIQIRVQGDADPGYGSTAKMLAESAVCLAQDDVDAAGGFHTTASAMGDILRQRLQRNAGVAFELEA